MRLLPSLVPTLLALSSLPLSHAWGLAGHEIVATLAEIHLQPSVLAYVRSSESGLLPEYAKGHLAPLSGWADRIRMVPEYRGWTGPLHYGSVDGDHPPDHCAWLEDGGEENGGKGRWHSDQDVLHAISNYTTRLERNPEDWEAFRFILHFLGDVHQPMHLTSRERGGNGDPVLWEGRRTNLHSLWDGLLIARTLREQSNYTRPLPSAQIESSLTGAIYDPFIRLLLWEGVRSWYRSSLPSWLACPPSSSSLFPSHPSQLILASSPAADKLQETVCPVRWATETHKVTCELAFPRGYDEHANPPVQIGGDSEFWRGLQDDKSLPRLLLQAGLRLAATLNTVLAAPAQATAQQNGWDAVFAAAEADGEGEKVYLGWVREAEAME